MAQRRDCNGVNIGVGDGRTGSLFERPAGGEPSLSAFAMSHLGEGVVEIRFNNDDLVCRYRVPWAAFCREVLLTDFAVRNGEAALNALMEHWKEEGAHHETTV